MNQSKRIEGILKDKLNAVKVEVVDQSFLHAGHNPGSQMGGTHYLVKIISDQFENKSLVERHRMVYRAMDDEFKNGLHALAIQAYTRNEKSFI